MLPTPGAKHRDLHTSRDGFFPTHLDVSTRTTEAYIHGISYLSLFRICLLTLNKTQIQQNIKYDNMCASSENLSQLNNSIPGLV